MIKEMSIEVQLAAPSFLIAVPQLGDPNFVRGVVFIMEHGDEGSMGLVINRSSELSMSSFYQSQKMDVRGNISGYVHKGGPVQTDRAFILHASEHEGPETENVFGKVSLSYSRESLKMIAQKPPDDLKVYLGYAGWGPGQLADEVTGGAWLVAPPNSDLLFNTPSKDVWERALATMGIDPIVLGHSGAVH